MNNKPDLAAMMAAFQNAGGKVQQVAEGVKSESAMLNDSVRYCTCGCEGNYTDHSMRKGEGKFADQ